MQRKQEVLVELEGSGELHHDLPHTLQELGEDGGGVPGVSGQVPTPGGGGRRCIGPYCMHDHFTMQRRTANDMSYWMGSRPISLDTGQVCAVYVFG